MPNIMPNFSDEVVLRSWDINAKAWITTIENQEIESRKLVTNQAIIDAIASYSPQSILDMGCGEGWLTRELSKNGINATGVDGASELVEKARALGGNFLVAAYEDIISTGLGDISFDAVVCNFSLLGNNVVDNLIKSLPRLLNNNGLLFIQTLHPIQACESQPYIDGWREESWNGFNSNFTPAPWYFRTLKTWIKLIQSSGFSILECREPIHPKTQKPASIIFVSIHNHLGFKPQANRESLLK